jgi:predicted nucleotidyltransferase
MLFTTITEDLQKVLKSNLPQIMILLKKNPAIAYKTRGDIGKKVGKKYNIELLVNFPHRGKIENFDMYGKQDLSFLVDKEKKRFPIDRNIIKEKAKEILGDVKTEDAYMYEDKEGARIIFNNNIQDKIDILPHSLHIWYEFTEPVTEFCNWLLENVYLMKENKS